MIVATFTGWRAATALLFNIYALFIVFFLLFFFLAWRSLFDSRLAFAHINLFIKVGFLVAFPDDDICFDLVNTLLNIWDNLHQCFEERQDDEVGKARL